jgi:hypothetical protein
MICWQGNEDVFSAEKFNTVLSALLLGITPSRWKTAAAIRKYRQFPWTAAFALSELNPSWNHQEILCRD